MRISLCMIVRNEAAVLERCLASAKPAIDELCIVDTGSTDDTVAICDRFEARRLIVPWNDDFAAARNRSLSLATGDWALVLDADEVLRSPHDARERLMVFAAEHPTSAGHVSIVNHTAEGAADETSTASVTRFFPREPEFRFAGRVHEQVLRSGAEPARVDTGCTLDHYGYTPQALASGNKLERNARLLERALAQAPKDAYLWYQMGRTLAVAERHDEALKAFEHALDHAPPDAPYGPHLVESAAYSLRSTGRSKKALEWLSGVEAQFRARADTCFLIALLAMDMGDLGRAERGFRHCLTLAGRAPFGGEASPSASTYAPNFNLGVMREVLGHVEEALAFYREALRHRADHGPSLAAVKRLSAPA